MSAGPKKPSLFADLGMGLGLRTAHYDDILNGRASVKWFEAISENYMEDGGRPIHMLSKIRENFPVALHGVSLNIASVDPLSSEYLKKLKSLIDRIEPSIVSDHCCWTSYRGQNLHDLMPVPFTEEAISHIAARIQKVQDFIGRRILLENVSSYVTFSHSEMTEWDFLSEIAKRADCGLILDVNNVYVNSVNHSFDPVRFLETLPLERVGQIHLAGHSEQISDDGKKYLIDTHDAAVCDDVWKLFEKTIELRGSISTMVEWDADIPEYARLEEEIVKAHNIIKKSSVKSSEVA